MTAKLLKFPRAKYIQPDVTLIESFLGPAAGDEGELFRVATIGVDLVRMVQKKYEGQPPERYTIDEKRGVLTGITLAWLALGAILDPPDTGERPPAS
jgi:hypothetical protein